MDNLSEEQKQRLIEAGQAVMNMSHGIKNIVQSIRSGRDVMDQALQRRDIEVAKRTWSILIGNLERIQTLSLNMLKFSKDEPLQREPCRFNRLVENVVKTVRPQADRRHVNIIIRFDEALDTVSVDPEKIQDVVMNLLLNATEAVPEKTGYVTVDTELDPERQQVILRISDNGPGIDDTRIIFEPFHSTKPNVGAGLGLTIVRKIIDRHGGTIDVQSRLQEGAVFTVRLPIQP